MSVFNQSASSHLTAKMFFDPNGGVDIARYDSVKYPEIEILTDTQQGFFWRPTEVDLNTDRGDFKKLSDHERHIFTANLKRQILLDSVQGRAPAIVFTPITGLPEMENFVQTWTFFETIHSRSYTHIIRNVYPDPSSIFDTLKDIPEIRECAADIARYYDEFQKLSLAYQMLGEGKHVVNGKEIEVSLYELKKRLYLTLVSINALEGIRFYVSFACSWAFAENKRMEGNAKIIKFICRDENLHLSLTQKLIKVILPKDDADFVRIREETLEDAIAIYEAVIEQEKKWARYLFKDGSIIGLNEALLASYVDWIAAQRMKAIGLPVRFQAPSSNPLPWTNSWISSKSVQVAPQEVELSNYVLGGVVQDVEANSFKQFKL